MIVEVLLDSSTTRLVMSSEFVRKQEFKLKKIRRLIYVRNVDGIFNKKGLIEISFFNFSNFSCISFIIFTFFNICYINFKEHREVI